MLRRLPALFLAALGLGGAALAQIAPNLIPTRDVAITYRATGGADVPAMEVTISWLAARRLLRMDTPGVGWSVADHANATGFIVMEDPRRVFDMPPSILRRQLGPSAEARFTREGAERIAGMDCTLWHYQDRSAEGRVCLAADGATLLHEGSLAGVSGRMEAIRVAYAEQDPVRFQLPEGYPRAQTRQHTTAR